MPTKYYMKEHTAALVVTPANAAMLQTVAERPQANAKTSHGQELAELLALNACTQLVTTALRLTCSRKLDFSFRLEEGKIERIFPSERRKLSCFFKL